MPGNRRQNNPQKFSTPAEYMAMPVCFLLGCYTGTQRNTLPFGVGVPAALVYTGRPFHAACWTIGLGIGFTLGDRTASGELEENASTVNAMNFRM